MKWIAKKYKFVWPGVFCLSLLGTATSFMGVYFALLSKRVLDIATGQSDGNLMHEAFYLGFCLLLQLALEIVLSVANVHVSGRFTIRAKTELFQTLLKKDYLHLTGYHSGELMNRINSDLSYINTGLVQLLPNLVYYLVTIVASFAALYVLDPFFACLCLLLGPFIFGFACLYRKRMKNLQKECQTADGRVKSFMLETLKNLLVIKSFGCEGAAAEQSRGLQFRHFRLNLKRNRMSILANAVFFLALTAGYYFALGWGAYKIAAGAMTFGSLTALLQLVGQIQSPFQGLSSLLPQYYNMLASGERIAELEALPEDEERSTLPLPQWESVDLANISFAYSEKSETVIKQSSLSIRRGQFVVVTGISGTGKSTLLKLLLGILRPNEGEMRLHKADGTDVPLKQFDRNLFAYVPQGNLIVSGSIRDNIAFFKTEIDEEKIIEAAKIAQIWDFIREQPDGLDTRLGENGLGLSEGQSQRLAVARAVFTDAPILLLDEATSALDEATELAILQALKQQKNMTCVLVSHKRAALDFCDMVLHFEHNTLREIAPHDYTAVV